MLFFLLILVERSLWRVARSIEAVVIEWSQEDYRISSR